MPKPRKELISLEATPYYHCVSRCVRRAFLCGANGAGKSFEHRRGWIESLLLEQAQVFAMDVAAYAVMSNHFHVVLHVNVQESESWSDQEVIERWHRLYKGDALSKQYLAGVLLSSVEQQVLGQKLQEWRERLKSISWFMRRLNETIARRANEEDGCTGHFWEGRFKSQALLDEKALIACMAYVDLNPVRANLAKTPEQSEYTSIKRRSDKAKKTANPNSVTHQADLLLPLVNNQKHLGIPMSVTDYLDLVDWTGRHIRADKTGNIKNNLPPIFERLGIDLNHWLYMTQNFESQFKSLVGTAFTIRNKARHFYSDKGLRRVLAVYASQQCLV